jgi:hypothetical protein
VTLPFMVTPKQVAQADPRFPPVAAGYTLAATAGTAPRTSVEIVAVADYGIDLVATFVAAAPAEGQSLVAALQTVDNIVYIDFNADLPLSWFAAVLKVGEITANTTAQLYSSDADMFIMQLNKAVTVKHDATGWYIPSYDASLYTVWVGFGLGADIVFFAYRAVASPMTTMLITADGYQLARSSGGQRIGDVVTASQNPWTMPLGGAYRLTFDSSGNGTLTTR